MMTQDKELSVPKGFTVRIYKRPDGSCYAKFQYAFQCNGKREYVYGSTTEECYEKAEEIKQRDLYRCIQDSEKVEINTDLLREEIKKRGLSGRGLCRMMGVSNNTIGNALHRGVISSADMTKLEEILGKEHGYFNANTDACITNQPKKNISTDEEMKALIKTLAKEIAGIKSSLTELSLVAKDGLAAVNTSVLKTRSELERQSEKLDTLISKWS